MQLPITFEPRFSFFGLIITSSVFLGAIVCVLCLPWWWSVKIILSIAIACGLMLFLRLYIYRGAQKAIVKIRLDSKGDWLLTDNKQNKIKVTLRGDSICSLYLVLLNFKVIDSRKKISVIILPDALSNENFRQLRIAVKGQRPKG